MALLGEASRIFRMGCSAWVAGGIIVLESDRGSPSLLLSFFASLPYKVSIFLQIRSCYDVLSCHRSKSRLTGLGTSETLNQNKHFFLVRLISFGCLYRRQKADKHSLCLYVTVQVSEEALGTLVVIREHAGCWTGGPEEWQEGDLKHCSMCEFSDQAFGKYGGRGLKEGKQVEREG